MSRTPLLVLIPLLVGCSPKAEVATDTATAMVAPAANYAGKWSIEQMPEGKDTVVLTYVLDATSDMNGWKFTLPGREPIDMRVISMTDDSVVAESGPFESALSKGTTVKMVHTSVHLDGDKLVGLATVHYDRPGADSLLILRQVGTRQ